MEFSFVDGERRKPAPGLKGVCGLCDGETISKCGNIRIHHWAHLRRQDCDPWWENETQWHRDWKSKFPEHCREVSVISSDGEKHRADVKTDFGRVIEFQHSPISSHVRQIREAFYKDMAWVVDGLRRESFREGFNIHLHQAKVLENTPIKLMLPTGGCSILKTWAGGRASVYMDFGDKPFTDDRFNFSKSILWRLCPVSSRYQVGLMPILREVFIDAALTGDSIKGIHEPEMPITPETKTSGEATKFYRREPVSPKFERRQSESDVDYAWRVWDFDRLRK